MRKNCLCHRKGNEFWANHNMATQQGYAVQIVFVTAKVMNFEQITTKMPNFFFHPQLSLSPQR